MGLNIKFKELSQERFWELINEPDHGELVCWGDEIEHAEPIELSPEEIEMEKIVKLEKRLSKFQKREPKNYDELLDWKNRYPQLKARFSNKFPYNEADTLEEYLECFVDVYDDMYEAMADSSNDDSYYDDFYEREAEAYLDPEGYSRRLEREAEESWRSGEC
jgi:hypothetical protein